MFIALSNALWINLAHVVKVERTEPASGIIKYNFLDANKVSLGTVDSKDAPNFNAVITALETFGKN